MQVECNNQVYPFGFGVRFEIEYQKRIGSTFGSGEPMTLEQSVEMFKIALEVGAKKQKKEFDLSDDDILDIIDSDKKAFEKMQEAMTTHYEIPNSQAAPE